MRKKLLTSAVFTALSVLSGLFLYHSSVIGWLDDSFHDALIRYFAPGTKVSDKIVLVLLDESTMKELPCRSPVPRDFLFKLNESILAAGPVAVGYDIFFKDPTIANNDRRLASSFKKGPVLSVSAGRMDASGKWYEDEPMPLFRDSLRGFGFADLPFSSSDSTVRRASFELVFGGRPRQSFVAELYKAATGGRAEALLHDPDRELAMFWFKFPPHRNGQTRIRFAGPPSTIGREDSPFKMFPAALVAEGLIPRNWLKDKIVLVGAAYDDGTDSYLTPYYSSRFNYERMPGVMIHANTLNSVLTKQFYYEFPPYLVVLYLFLLGIVSSLIFLSGGVRRGVIGASALTILMALKAVLCFNRAGLLMPFVPFEGAMLITFGATLGFRSVTEGRQKRFIKNVFAKYVPPSVVERMIEDPSLLRLGGEAREITCLFTDIASFTTISERLDPKTLVSFLNDYLDRLTRIIFEHGGTLDKYEGDAIIAFFGAPLNLPDHRTAAVMAALDMQKASREISDKWKDVCGREIVTRIGINSGTAVVGNMGSDLRFDYTAIGDTMNLASRLEGANKFFGTSILAGGNTVDPIIKNGDIVFGPVARLKVKGKNEPVPVYRVAGLASEMPKEEAEKIKNGKFPEDIVELTSK